MSVFDQGGGLHTQTNFLPIMGSPFPRRVFVMSHPAWATGGFYDDTFLRQRDGWRGGTSGMMSRSILSRTNRGLTWWARPITDRQANTHTHTYSKEMLECGWRSWCTKKHGPGPPLQGQDVGFMFLFVKDQHIGLKKTLPACKCGATSQVHMVHDSTCSHKDFLTCFHFHPFHPSIYPSLPWTQIFVLTI